MVDDEYEHALKHDDCKFVREAVSVNDSDFHRLFEWAADGIVLVHAESGEIVEVNQTYVAMSGCSRDSLLGKKLWEVPALRGIDSKLVLSLASQGAPERVFFGGLALETKEGKRLETDILCIAQRISEGRIIQCNIRDVAERKRIEQARSRSEDQFRRLFESNPHPMWVFESGSLLFLAVNGAAIETYGYSLEEFMRMTMRDILIPDELPDFLTGIGGVKSPPLTSDTWKHRKKNGEVIDMEMASNEILFNNRKAYFVVATDVTVRKQSEDLLKETRQLLQKMLNALPIGVLITDSKGNIIIGNPAIKKIWGDERSGEMERYDEYKGWWAQSGKRIEAGEWAASRAVLKGETSLDEIIEIEGFDGSRKTILNSAIPLKDSSGKTSGAIVVNQDITERRRQEEELRRVQAVLERQATTDPLTGIFNRLKFNELLDLETREALRYNHPLSLIMFDVDYFKAINDTYGHLVGDVVLKEIALLISKNIRNVDIFARWGGEEFIILSPNNGLKRARKLADKLCHLIAQFHFSCPCTVTASFGVAQFTAEDTFGSLVKRADDSLYRAKERGRNRVEAG